MLKHVICHKYTDPAEAEKILPMLKGLVGKVPALISMEGGVDVSREARSYDLAIVATVRDRAALREYLDHPEHLKVRDYIHTVLASGVCVDFEE